MASYVPTLRQRASAAVDADNVYDLLGSGFGLHQDLRELSEAVAEFDRCVTNPPRDIVGVCTDIVRRSDSLRTSHVAWRLLAKWKADKQAWMCEKLKGLVTEWTPSSANETVDTVEACVYLGVTVPSLKDVDGLEWNDALVLRLSKRLPAAKFVHPAPSEWKVGEGASGSVWESVSAADRVIKVVTCFSQYVMRERNVLMLLRHDHLVRGFSARIHNGVAYMEMERAPYGCLSDVHLCDGGRHVGWMAAQLLSAVDCLHDHELVHGDIRPPNVLVFGPRTVKLCDFGHTQTYESVKGGVWCEFEKVESCHYPPEMYAARGPVTNAALRKVDWWGVGNVLLYVAGWRRVYYPSEIENFIHGVHSEFTSEYVFETAEAAAFQMMQLEISNRSDVAVRALVDSGMCREPLFETDEQEEECRRTASEGVKRCAPSPPSSKRRRGPDLNEVAFEFWPECEDSALALDPRCRELLIRKM